MIETGILDRGIQVAGLRLFAASNWQEALLYYLFGVWSDDHSVTHRPKIRFGSYELRLSSATETYSTHVVTDGSIESVPEFDDDATLTVGSSRAEVENALIRFVRNGSLRKLVLCLGSEVRFCLWKKSRCGDYGVSVHGMTGQPS